MAIRLNAIGFQSKEKPMDHRYKAQALGSWYEHFNHSSLLATIFVDYVDADGHSGSTERLIPCKMQVCPTCEGKGTHVNPAIDENGISQETFDQDPDFEQAYHAGQYDVVCFQCGGLRVVPWPKNDRDIQTIEGIISNKMAMISLQHAEERMGY